jgi:hypothetical protein
MWDAVVGWTVFGDVDLSGVKSLETVQHLGPSTIGIDTIYRSKGRIPEEFLRGAGVPEQFVACLPALATQDIESDTCFIAYANEDEEVARTLEVDLQRNGVRCWLAPGNMQLDDRIRQSIDPTIRLHDRLLLMLSEHSIAATWVVDVVEVALEEEQLSERSVLLLMRVDNQEPEMGTPWLEPLRATHPIHDFSRWQDEDRYRESLHRLLHALRGGR